MADPASRLITLIMLLQRQPNQKAADLAAELGISVRTLHRYFTALDEMGIPVYSERGPNGGFSLVRGYRMPPLVLTPEEAVAVYLGVGMVEEVWGQLYRDAAHGAQAKLENVLPDEQRHEAAWARRTLFVTGMHRGSLDALTPVLEKLRRAAREHRRIRVTYQGRSQVEAAERDLDPYALVHRWGWWYVIGFCHTRRGIRTFRVDRIQQISLHDLCFDPPSDFDLRSYLDQEQQMVGGLYVKVRFSPELARMVIENQYVWNEAERQADGALVVGFYAPDIPSAVSMTFAYGPGALVLEPEEVRRKAFEYALEVTRQYQNA